MAPFGIPQSGFPSVGNRYSGGNYGWLKVVVLVFAAWLLWRAVGPSFFASRSAVAPNTPLSVLEIVPLTNAAAPVTLGDLQNKVTVVNFWGTWCPPCVEEFPHLAALERQYRGRDDFRFLSVSCASVPEDLSTLRAETESFLRAGRYDLPIYADPDGATRRGVPGAADFVYPLTLLVDRRGIVVSLLRGYRPADVEQLKLHVATLLRQPR